MDTTNKLKCRKCGGQHLTIKCGKTNEDISLNTSSSYRSDTSLNTSSSYSPSYRSDTSTNYRSDTSSSYKINKIKISNLPSDLTFNELNEMLHDWGHISKVYVKNYNDSSLAILEFKFENEMEYFITALNNTPFEHQIITITKLDS
jgi:hypothetical protein